MSLIRNSGRGRGLTVLALVALMALIATLLGSAPAQSSASLTSTAVMQVQAVLPASTLTLAEDEYVDAVRAGTSDASVVMARSQTGIGTMYPAGPGHADGPVWAGLWEINGRRALCYQFNLHNPNSNGEHLATRLPGASRHTSLEIFYGAGRFAHTNKQDLATGAALATWKKMGGDGFNTYFSWGKRNDVFSAGVLSAYNRVLKEMKRHGPYKMKAELKGGEKLVGQDGRVAVTVKNSHGGVKGVAVQMDSTNARTSKQQAVTNRNGVAVFKYTRTGTDRVRFVARVSAPSTKGYLTSPSGGNQALVAPGPAYKKSASVSYQRKAPAPSVDVKCETGCKKATVILGGKNPKGSKPIRYVIEVNGKVKAKLDLRPGSKKSLSRDFPDGTKGVVYACYIDRVGGKCVTPRVKMKRFTVVCPPWAKAQLVTQTTMACEGCSSKTNSLMFWAPDKSSRFYVGTYLLNGNPKSYKFPADGEWHQVNGVNNGKVTAVGFEVYRTADRTGKLLDITFDCPTCG
ncbi:TPA: hypothetical protein DCF80_00820 [Candidatus Saccharibacteria bacterium]|nr:hypothetical protein [Candidatus Saccharibacteria bacterium]HRK40856.1 Ig-like domain-containing protein [Candidatus Saccharibacteria bacterium]